MDLDAFLRDILSIVLCNCFKEGLPKAVSTISGSTTAVISLILQDADIILIKIGPHENFYRELKKYLREVGL